jgi:hypothetical protein
MGERVDVLAKGAITKGATAKGTLWIARDPR